MRASLQNPMNISHFHFICNLCAQKCVFLGIILGGLFFCVCVSHCMCVWGMIVWHFIWSQYWNVYFVVCVCFYITFLQTYFSFVQLHCIQRILTKSITLLFERIWGESSKHRDKQPSYTHKLTLTVILTHPPCINLLDQLQVWIQYSNDPTLIWSFYFKPDWYTSPSLITT